MKIKISNLGKQYKKGFWGIRDINLTLENGVTALLGENGAGKSTLMKILSTLSVQDCGEILIDGINTLKNPDYLRKNLGYLPQSFGVYKNLNAIEFLQYIAAAKGINKQVALKRIQELLHMLNLHDCAKRKLKEYSGGMRQRVGIAQALLNDPRLLILDEPTVGLDPGERVNIRNILSEISRDRIILYSTHIVSDIETISDKIAIMDKGRLSCNDSFENITNAAENKVWKVNIPYSDLSNFKLRYLVSSINRVKDRVELRVISSVKPLKNAERLEPILEDAYLLYTSKNKRGEI